MRPNALWERCDLLLESGEMSPLSLHFSLYDSWLDTIRTSVAFGFVHFAAKAASCHRTPEKAFLRLPWERFVRHDSVHRLCLETAYAWLSSDSRVGLVAGCFDTGGPGPGLRTWRTDPSAE